MTPGSFSAKGLGKNGEIGQYFYGKCMKSGEKRIFCLLSLDQGTK